jgi:hypothetical protein
VSLSFVVVVVASEYQRRRRRCLFTDIFHFRDTVVRIMSDPSSTPSLVFPTPTLTKIIGRPNNSTLQLLQQQLFQNARAITSTRGGGRHGHLGLVMPPAEYLQLAGEGNNFAVPRPPGDMAAAPAGATSAQLFDIRRLHDQRTKAYNTYHAVRTALQNQIIDAVEDTYLQSLKHVDFGYHDVEPYTMLSHLKTTYGILTGHEIELNRAKLGDAWDPSTPIEDLWARITEIRRVAASVGQPISDAAVIALVLPMIERTGLFRHSVDMWNTMELELQTYVRFQSHFTRANELRITKLTSSDLQYADANLAVKSVASPASTTITTTSTSSNPVSHIQVDNVPFYYCWTHGLSPIAQHTSATCRQPAEGHKHDATAYDRKGGTNTFRTPRHNTSN